MIWVWITGIGVAFATLAATAGIIEVGVRMSAMHATRSDRILARIRERSTIQWGERDITPRDR